MVKEETKKFAKENRKNLEQVARNGSTSASRIAEAILSLVPEEEER